SSRSTPRIPTSSTWRPSPPTAPAHERNAGEGRSGMNVASWLDATARARPHAPAVFLGTEQVATYGELAARARARAAGMAARHGIGQGDRVAVFLKNVPDYLELFYAV